MYDHIRTLGWTSKVFFFTLFVQGNLILLNLFLAILLKNFEDDLDGGEDDHDANVVTVNDTSHDCTQDNTVDNISGGDDDFKRMDEY